MATRARAGELRWRCALHAAIDLQLGFGRATGWSTWELFCALTFPSRERLETDERPGFRAIPFLGTLTGLAGSLISGAVASLAL